MAQPPPENASAIDAIIPTNPLAAIACWLGVFSVVICGIGAVLGVPAVILGVMSLKRGAMKEQTAFGKSTSKVRSYIGIISGALGILLGIAMLVSVLLKPR